MAKPPPPPAHANADPLIATEVPPQAEASTTTMAGYAEFGVSPIPPPSMLERYERATPGSSAKIVEFIEREQAHRHQFENRLLGKQGRESWLGQILGAFLGLAGFTTAGAFAAYGHPLPGAIIAVALVVGLIVRGVIRVQVGDKTAEIDMTEQAAPTSRRLSRPATAKRKKKKAHRK